MGDPGAPSARLRVRKRRAAVRKSCWGRRGQVSLEEDAPIGDTHQVTIITHHTTFLHPFVDIKSSPPRV